MHSFEEEVKNPEDYAIFYLDAFGESLSDDMHRPWQRSAVKLKDPVKLFQVDLQIS